MANRIIHNSTLY